MAITFSKRADGTAWADFSTSMEEGSLDTIAPRVAGALFSQTAAPQVGDIIVFEKGSAPSRRISNTEVPTWLRTEGNTHYFECVKGVAMYTVTAVAANEQLTVRREWT